MPCFFKAPPRFVKKMVDMACMTEEKLAMEVIVEGSPKPVWASF